jgi:hypothetical protein
MLHRYKFLFCLQNFHGTLGQCNEYNWTCLVCSSSLIFLFIEHSLCPWKHNYSSGFPLPVISYPSKTLLISFLSHFKISKIMVYQFQLWVCLSLWCLSSGEARDWFRGFYGQIGRTVVLFSFQKTFRETSCFVSGNEVYFVTSWSLFFSGNSFLNCKNFNLINLKVLETFCFLCSFKNDLSTDLTWVLVTHTCNPSYSGSRD